MSYYPDFFLSETETFRDKTYEDFLETWNKTYEKIARNVNVKDFGYYTTEEMVNGQKWSNIATVGSEKKQEYKTVYRKRVDLGALKSSGTSSIAHGITITANTIVTRLYGAATDPSTTFIPLPYVAANSIYLSMDATNVIVQTTDDKTGFTAAYVIIEYVQE